MFDLEDENRKMFLIKIEYKKYDFHVKKYKKKFRILFSSFKTNTT